MYVVDEETQLEEPFGRKLLKRSLDKSMATREFVSEVKVNLRGTSTDSLQC